MINEEIRDREVRVVDENGEQLGIMLTRQALEMAEQKDLDLVKIAPQARPPVCKFMDYGKYRFEQSKRNKEARKNQKVIEVKEIRLSPTIEDHDIDVRVRNAIKFLQEGNKLKCSIRFRGRMVTHSEIGVQVMQSFFDRIKDHAVMDRRPLTEGRMMTMMLSPKVEAPEKKAKPKQDEASASDK
ncbi:MAG: translation initiation factor IF-3 [Clostridiales bacterium]|jgi:translation initiation factor IF-3|nr:translation initiation factor IF-3 [Clostridiales bacterium]